ncbi:MAG: DUF4177 domain-containing protein [Phycisphaerae bacterium]|nr:DUF4177 domain-containing protein [Phycisphaerae bacterium]
MRWEYMTLKLAAEGWFLGGKLDVEKLDTQLNALGRDGWEVVSAFDTNQAYGASRDIVVILKRPTSR